MYTMKGRVRFSETTPDHRLTTAGIVNYLQDCSTFNSEDIGKGFEYLGEKKRAWLLTSWQIEIVKRPVFGEEFTVSTWPLEFKGIYAMRNFAIRDLDDNLMVKAHSIWFLLDVETGKPARITEDDVLGYGEGDDGFEMVYAPRKIKLPDGFTDCGEFTVTENLLDTNHHMNNARYIEMAALYLPDGFEIGTIRAEYKQAAAPGMKVICRKAACDGGQVISLCAEDGMIFANVQFIRK